MASLSGNATTTVKLQEQDKAALHAESLGLDTLATASPAQIVSYIQNADNTQLRKAVALCLILLRPEAVKMAEQLDL